MTNVTSEGKAFNPKILAFSTNNISVPGIDLAGSSHLLYPPGVMVISMPCTSGIKPEWVLYAVEKGFDGVFIAADGEECAYLPDCAERTTHMIKRAQAMLLDVKRSRRSNTTVDQKAGLAEKIAKLNLPPMIYFKAANRRVSLWLTIPVGLGTGLLAATIAVGGFIGVPGMIYVLGVPAMVASATELVIAFVMGMSGSITWSMGGYVDIRMVLLILAGSLIGVQLGAVGTTYVKEYMIKLVMATIMIIVAVSRGFAIPGYLNELETIKLGAATIHTLNNISFLTMCFALATGGIIILVNMWKGKREIKQQEEAGEKAQELVQHS